MFNYAGSGPPCACYHDSSTPVQESSSLSGRSRAPVLSLISTSDEGEIGPFISSLRDG